jgi:periplasmic divalent cation tolerance protein
MAAEVLLVFTTWPDQEQARSVCRVLVEEKLAACGNILPAVHSIYRWKDAVESTDEILVLLKTTSARYAALAARVKELHLYEVPEIIAVSAAEGLPEYLAWLAESCRD